MGSLETAAKEQLVRTLYDAANRGDLDGILAQVHPEVEVRLAVEGMEPVEGSRSELHGRDGLAKFFRLLDESWEAFHVEIKELVEGADEHILSFETWTVRGAQGIEVATEMVDVFGFRDGLIVSCDGFRDKHRALAAFGDPA
jgi:ketosteroid isomerase-like protein